MDEECLKRYNQRLAYDTLVEDEAVQFLTREKNRRCYALSSIVDYSQSVNVIGPVFISDRAARHNFKDDSATLVMLNWSCLCFDT